MDSEHSFHGYAAHLASRPRGDTKSLSCCDRAAILLRQVSGEAAGCERQHRGLCQVKVQQILH